MKMFVTLFGLKNKPNNDGEHAGFPKNPRKLKRLQKRRMKRPVSDSFKYSKNDKLRAEKAYAERDQEAGMILLGPPRCGKGFCFNKECFVSAVCQEQERKNGRPFTRA